MRRIAASTKLDLPMAAPFHLKRLLRLQARNDAVMTAVPLFAALSIHLY